MSPVIYGCAFDENVRIVGLWWYSIPITANLNSLDSDIERNARNALGQSGIYVFEGKHDSRPEGGILYIGKVGDQIFENEEKTNRSLKTRLDESRAKLCWQDKRGKERGLYADVWDVVIRFATVDPNQLKHIETILIKAHAPSFNGQLVRGAIADDDPASNLIVMNAGSKGRLLPTIAGMYYCRNPWWQMTGG